MSTVLYLPNGRNGLAAESAGPFLHRVLFVVGEVRDDGVGHAVLRLARELRRRGKEVSLACGGGALAGEFERIGIRPCVSRQLARPGRPLLLSRSLLAYIRDNDPELIHLFGRGLADWGMRLSAAAGRPYVLTVMTFSPTARGGGLHGKWRRGSILVPSQELREELVNRDHVPKDAIAVVRLGVALDDYERYREAEGSATAAVVGTVGPLTPERGVEYFVRAAREILDRGGDAHFVIAGDGPERAALRRLVRKLDLDDSVTMVQHFSDYREMIAMLDVCVIPALQEALSLNVVEAMACRKPVVATGVGPVCGIITDGETGFLAPRKDPEAIAERVLRLLGDRELARRIADAALEMVRERFSMEASVRGLLTFYGRCLQRSEGS